MEAFNLNVEENKKKLEGNSESGGKTYRWRKRKKLEGKRIGGGIQLKGGGNEKKENELLEKVLKPGDVIE